MRAAVVTLLGIAAALVTTPGELPATALAVAAAALLVALSCRAVSLPAATAFASVGRRSRSHRHAIDRLPEPAHPSTPGRRRSRAPGMPLRVA